MPIVSHRSRDSDKSLPGVEILPEIQKDQLFKKIDKNGDTVIDKKELVEAFKEMGAIFAGWRAGRAMVHVDSDSNGVITYDEFQQLVNYARSRGYTVK